MNIQIQHLSKKYRGRYALEDFSVTLENGVYGLLGTNGAGKTTFLNMFMGVISNDGGEIFVDGENIRRLGASFLSCIGYLPQTPLFYRDFTVEEFLRYMCVLKGLGRTEGRARIDEMLETVNLTDAAKKKVGALSGGMRQRLGIAQAMLNDPGILILDEPTAGLDPRERIRFRNLLSKFAGDRIIIIATHIVSDVEFIANQILLVNEGHLVAQGSPTQLYDELAGQVWALNLDAPDVPEELVHHTISNLARMDDGIHMRILSAEQPHPDAVPVTASLEEVFLYHCGEDAD
ncbi:MAG: ABC transporter ATP-binding protein [Lachnospiraceae bacterium]|nr:ABC transporter ATP-binding protein [Lachnospiraceae bacterium]